VEVLRLDLEQDESPAIACPSCRRILVEGVKSEGDTDCPPELPASDARLVSAPLSPDEGNSETGEQADETSCDDETWPDDAWAGDEHTDNACLDDDDWSLSSGEDWAMYNGQQDVC